jgi:hypothetical protein
MAVYANIWGKDGGYQSYMDKRRDYRPLEAYNYDKFGFHSNIPRSLWDW